MRHAAAEFFLVSSKCAIRCDDDSLSSNRNGERCAEAAAASISPVPARLVMVPMYINDVSAVAGKNWDTAVPVGYYRRRTDHD